MTRKPMTRSEDMACPRCQRCTAQPVEGDKRMRLCTACETLTLVGAANPAFPAGIRKGRRCTACGRCTVAIRTVPCWGATVLVFSCRNPECGTVGVYPEEPISVGPSEREAPEGSDDEVLPIPVSQGISDLLDEVRR